MEKNVKVIFLRCLVLFFKAALGATMENGVFSTLHFHAHRFHKPETCCPTVTRIDVNVLAPKTLRTMIGIAAPAYKETTSLTEEVFFGTLELLGSHHSITFMFGC